MLFILYKFTMSKLSYDTDLIKDVKLSYNGCYHQIIINNDYWYTTKYNTDCESYMLDKFIMSNQSYCTGMDDNTINANIKPEYIQICVNKFIKNSIIFTKVGDIIYECDYCDIPLTGNYKTPNLLGTRLDDIETKQKTVTICGKDYDIKTTTKLKLSSSELTKLTQLPDSIGQLINLTELVIGGNNLTCLPDWIGQLTNLTHLFVDNNSLTYLPDSIGQLTNLRSLIVHCSKITKLPDSIGQLTNLTCLCMLGDELIFIPDSIGQLTNLAILHIRNNKLTHLPDSIGQLTNLIQLDISDNKLTCLPDFITKLTKLTKLFIYGNSSNKDDDYIGNYLEPIKSESKEFESKASQCSFDDKPKKSKKNINKHRLLKKYKKYKTQTQKLNDDNTKLRDDNVILTDDNIKLQNNIIALTDRFAQYDADIAIILNDLL
jgi:Leucine-rich repeat (LRR) protein